METVPKFKITPFSFLSNVQYEHLVAGVSAGLASTLALHPLDLIKIRFAVNDGKVYTSSYRGIANAFFTIFRQESFFGLYKGVTPNLWGAGSSWGLYFLFYNAIKSELQGGDHSIALSPIMHLIAASQAGAITLCFTNPVWVVKTRMCLQYSSITKVPEEKRYKGIFDALTKIYRSEGIRGYYKGFIPGLFGVSHGAVQFMTYEELKNRYNRYKNVPINTKLGNLEYVTFAAVSKLIAAALTYPYQVIRARLQDHHHSYSGSIDCIKKTWAFEGWRGFYKGLGPNLLRVTPATMITFVIYENLSHRLTNNASL